jgi:hypothetical protein
MTTKERQSNKIFWVFAENGIESQIYKTVKEKKNYTLKYFYERKNTPSKDYKRVGV